MFGNIICEDCKHLFKKEYAHKVLERKRHLNDSELSIIEIYYCPACKKPYDMIDHWDNRYDESNRQIPSYYTIRQVVSFEKNKYLKCVEVNEKGEKI